MQVLLLKLYVKTLTYLSKTSRFAFCVLKAKNQSIFVTSEKFRMGLVIGHAIFFINEKSHWTNQIASGLRSIIFGQNDIYEMNNILNCR